MTEEKLLIDHIVATPDVCFGKPRIKDTRMTVQFLALFVDDPEWPIHKICDNYALTPAQVHAAWSYYYDHKHIIDAEIRDADEKYRQSSAPDIYTTLEHKS